MKRIIILVILLGLTAVYGSIGENFKASGNIISGGAYVLLNGNYSVLSFSPGFERFIADNVSLSVDPSYQYQSFTGGGAHYLGVNGGLKYYLVGDPAASRGTAHSIGGSLGAGIAFASGYRSSTMVTLSPQYRFYYFITSRIAPYLGITLNGDFNVSYEDFDMSTMLLAGISFHFPSRDYVMPK